MISLDSLFSLPSPPVPSSLRKHHWAQWQTLSIPNGTPDRDHLKNRKKKYPPKKLEVQTMKDTYLLAEFTGKPSDILDCR